MADINPEPIMNVSLGFMAAKHLFVANEIGVFEKLAHMPATLDELAERTRIPRRTVRIVADAMVYLGFLEKQDEQYRNSAVAAAFLSGGPGMDLRPLLRFRNHISYRNWLDFEAAVRTGSGHTMFGQMSEAEQRIASEGIAAITMPAAAALATTYDFGRHRHVLDLGGGTGSFLVAVLGRHPRLSATLYELPGTAAVARRELAGKPEASRIKIVDGDFFRDALPQGADAVIVANVVHLLSPARNFDMFRRVRQQVASGTRLLLVDFWTDPTHTLPSPVPLLAGGFLMFSSDGDVYSAEEGRSWLRETGWQPIEHKPLAGAASLLIAGTAT